MIILAFISYTLFLLCLYLGYDSIVGQEKTPVHKLYILLIALYCLWNLGMTLYHFAGTKEIAFFIFNLSSNWIALFTLPLFLHFTLFFTHAHLEKKYLTAVTIVFYIPYIVLQILSLFPRYTWLDSVIATDTGWQIKTSLFSVTNLLLITYMTAVCLCGFSMIILWGIRAKSGKIKRQAGLLAAATLAASLFSACSYMLWMFFQSSGFPYTNHFATFFLAVGFKIAISRYRFLEVSPQIALPDIINNIEDFFLLYDKNGTMIASNMRINEILGYQADDVEKRSPDIVVDNTKMGLDSFISRRKPDTPESVNLNFVSKTNEYIPVRLSITDIRDRFSEIIGCLVIGHDERIRRDLDLERMDKLEKERSLEASEAQYRKTINSLTDYIFVIGTDYRMLLYNEACLKYARSLGIGEELKGRLLEDIFPHFLQKTKGSYEEVFRTGRQSANRYSIEMKDKMMSYDYSLLPVSEGTAVRKIISIVRDITDQKRAEENLIQTTRLDSLGILAGGIAHDFNNALTGIIANISFVTGCLCDNETKEINAILAETINAAMKAKNLTLQLLTFAKGGMNVKKTGSIRTLLEESVYTPVRDSNCTVNLRITDNLRLVEMDGGQISTALQNIMFNARESMPAGGEIHVRAANVRLSFHNTFNLKSGHYVKISITDKGHGIDPLIADRIFDPYFSTKEDGHGLGLATAFTIIRNHQGYIDVHSVPGRGSTFHIYLPATTQKNIAEPTVERPGDLKNINVLLLEDDRFIQNVVERVIRHMKGTITITESGDATVKAYKKAMEEHHRFDVVLLDLTIPGGMGGKETIQHLLRIDPDVKGIVCSGYSTDPVISRYREYGFRYYLKKPFDLNEFLDVISIVVNSENDLG